MQPGRAFLVDKTGHHLEVGRAVQVSTCMEYHDVRGLDCWMIRGGICQLIGSPGFLGKRAESACSFRRRERDGSYENDISGRGEMMIIWAGGVGVVTRMGYYYPVLCPVGMTAPQLRPNIYASGELEDAGDWGGERR